MLVFCDYVIGSEYKTPKCINLFLFSYVKTYEYMFTYKINV